MELQALTHGCRYLREYQSLGTAGGLHHFKDEILRGNAKSFYVLNAGESVLILTAARVTD
jgi:hypothetical protein